MISKKARFIVDREGRVIDQKVTSGYPPKLHQPSNTMPASVCPKCRKVMSHPGLTCDACAQSSPPAPEEPLYSYPVRLIILTVSAIVLSIIVGFVHAFIQLGSAALLHGVQFLVYPSIIAGIVNGKMLGNVRRVQKLDNDGKVIAIAFLGGFIAFLFGVAVIPHEGIIYSVSSEHAHSEELSTSTYLILVIGEAICSIGLTIKGVMSD